VSNGSGAAVAGLVIGIILAANAAGWGDDDGDGLALESGDSGTGEDTTTSEPAVPTSVDGGVTARPHPGLDDTDVITVTDRSDVVRTLADHHVRAVLCPRPTDAWRKPLCDATTNVVAIAVRGDQRVGSTTAFDGIADIRSDEGFTIPAPAP